MSAESSEIENQIRALLAEGRILEATRLLKEAGDLVPADSKIRKVLSPPIIRKSDRRDVDRSPEFRWLNENSSRFSGQWVALVGENLVASSDSLKGLLAQLNLLHFERRPLIHHLI